MKYIDLTHKINEATPVYPGDMKVEITPQGSLEQSGYLLHHIVCIGTHVGTHIDAPAHMIEGGKTLDKYDLSKFVGNGVLVDVRGQKEIISIPENIKPSDIVLFMTGMDKSYSSPRYFEDYPVMTAELAEALIEKGVKMVGLDTCSPDKAPYEIHKLLLKNDILIIENLVNLDQLTDKSFKVLALPLSLQTEGAPARVTAEYENGIDINVK